MQHIVKSRGVSCEVAWKEKTEMKPHCESGVYQLQLPTLIRPCPSENEDQAEAGLSIVLAGRDFFQCEGTGYTAWRAPL